MSRLAHGIPLGWFLVGIITSLLLLPVLFAAATWQIVGDRQQLGAEKRVAQALRFVQAGADRADDPRWQTQLGTRLAELRVSGSVYLIGGFGKRPVYIHEPEAARDSMKLVPVATTSNGTVAAALSADPLEAAYRMAWALVAGLGALTAGLVAALWLFDRWLIGPLRRFSDTVDRIAGGEPTEGAPRSPLREVANVSEALTGMGAALGRAAVQEEMLDRERRLLIGTIAHDLRTPLFALRGYLQALRQGLGTRDDYMAKAEAKAAQLERLIGDLFALTRLEYLNERPQRRRIDLGEFLRQAVAAYEPLAARDWIKLDVGGDCGVDVVVDSDHLDRVVANLLDNAFAHTPREGTVSVRWGGDGATAWFTVADSGDGIPDAALPHLFEPLFRAARSGTRDMGSAGLGLTIAQRLLHANGGQLSADNGPAGGAVFTATLRALVHSRSGAPIPA
jgi:signal transduction histidine kinase